MRRYYTYFSVSLSIILLLCVLFASSCSNSSDKDKKAGIPVPALKITSSSIPFYKDYIGTSQSIAEVGIRARVKGFLERMNFVEGKPVQKNQLLFVIDPRPFQAKVDLAEGDLIKAQAKEEFQKVEFERMQTLIKTGDVSQARHDQVEAEYKSSVGAVKSARANLEEAKINLGYTSMYSPFDGLIGEKFVDVGNLVGGTDETLLANVVQLNPIYVLFNPSVGDYAQMLSYRENMPFKVKVTLPENKTTSFEGSVDLINNQADVDTSTILMRAIIKNPDNLLLPGIYVNVRVLLTDNKKVLLVPSEAVLNIQGQQNVFIVNKESKVETRKITTSGEFKESWIIESGLKEGDIVILEGLQKLKPGMKVTAKLKDHG